MAGAIRTYVRESVLKARGEHTDDFVQGHIDLVKGAMRRGMSPEDGIGYMHFLAVGHTDSRNVFRSAANELNDEYGVSVSSPLRVARARKVQRDLIELQRK